MEQNFASAIRNNDLEALKQIPKSDLHIHGGLGCRIQSLEKALGYKIESPPKNMAGLTDMNKYINDTLRPIYRDKNVFEFAIAAALFQAEEDGVKILEMSIDSSFINLYEHKEDEIVEFLKEMHRKHAPEVDFRPEIGINKELKIEEIESYVYPLIETGYFESIDLYGTEDAKEFKEFREIYRKAKSTGLKCKAHAGEFCNANSVREAVETLELEAVQHGINIVHSKEIMQWIKNNDIQLNICPTSNIVLNVASSIQNHPIRELFDFGIKLTINTDDLLIFDQSVSEEYLMLYNENIFSETELNQIRLTGLSC